MVPFSKYSRNKMTVTNNSGISLTLAVWLVNDDYDYISMPNYVSVTRLMAPLKQLILSKRVPLDKQAQDVEDRIPSALGTAIHDSIEKAWVQSYAKNLNKLGYPQSVIDRVLINPTDEQVLKAINPIPIYLEQRGFREINGFTLGGKFDMVAEGHIEDNKTTSAYSWVFGTRDDDHRLQGSLYRWIDAAREHPRITEDYIRINYVFTDWQRAKAATDSNYPSKRTEHKDLALLSLKETEAWINNKLNQVIKFMELPEEEIPECSDEDLWRSAPKFKYFADPTKTTGRSTRNFDSNVEARQYMAEKGGKGIVITVPGEVKRCGYCPAYEICKQKDRYFNDKSE